MPNITPKAEYSPSEICCNHNCKGQKTTAKVKLPEEPGWPKLKLSKFSEDSSCPMKHRSEGRRRCRIRIL
ncbi:hypothetical protein RvY_17397 [Ramazzottius varieornatus]|uniref:Uncharacterized protein n=1 Tax=Ramazzottius varieornatus TaxID=947166 RepID=A0A1D1W5V7_RAMVA|nr:hypothetical protein RvY_17397 [Ramazzottius varieornatus]